MSDAVSLGCPRGRMARRPWTERSGVSRRGVEEDELRCEFGGNLGVQLTHVGLTCVGLRDGQVHLLGKKCLRYRELVLQDRRKAAGQVEAASRTTGFVHWIDTQVTLVGCQGGPYPFVGSEDRRVP